MAWKITFIPLEKTSFVKNMDENSMLANVYPEKKSLSTLSFKALRRTLAKMCIKFLNCLVKMAERC